MRITRLDPQASQFLANLERIHQRSQRAERQIASGLRVEKASDAPAQVAEILRLRTRVEVNVQTQTNLARVNAHVSAAESAVREAVSLLEKARVIGAQTATYGAAGRQTLATQARQLHQSLIGLTGVSSEGRYVFGGDGASSPPYQADATAANGVRLVSGSAVNSMRVADDKNTTFSVSRTASEIFDAPGAANVFKAVEDLARALDNDSEVQVQTALPALVSALDHLNAQLTFYGSAQNRVTGAIDAAKKNAIALRSDLSELQETDLPAAILELNAAKVHHEAALLAQSKIPRTTLFDFLG